MSDWFTGLAGEQYARALIWTVAALILLLVVLLVVRIVRGMTSGTFVTGGRNRRPRLAVTDAMAVDNQRRLVLVRRDDVEHLVLIGGPSDIVVEQNIRAAAPRTSTAPAETPRRQPQRTVQPPAPAVPPARERVADAPAPRPHPVTPPRTEPVPPSAQGAAPQQLDTPPRPHEPTPEQSAAPAPATLPAQEPPRDQPQVRHEIDEMFAEGFEPRPETGRQKGRRHDDSSLEDEMSRLLEELSEERRQ
jgi:hypothetical protein